MRCPPASFDDAALIGFGTDRGTVAAAGRAHALDFHGTVPVDHWRKHGFEDIRVTSERVPIQHDVGVWITRSNLINGLPPSEKISP